MNDTLTLFTVLSILFGHWLFDFVFQSHWMASNKSKSNIALGAHVGVYTIGLILMGFNKTGLTVSDVFLWVSINAVLHFITDYFTSRITSKLFGNDWHNFFVVVGLDQLIHYSTLLTTLVLIKN